MIKLAGISDVIHRRNLVQATSSAWRSTCKLWLDIDKVLETWANTAPLLNDDKRNGTMTWSTVTVVASPPHVVIP